MTSQVLVNTGPTTVTRTWYVDGTATDPGDATYGIVDGNGATVVAAGTSPTDNGDGTFTYALAAQSNVTRLLETFTIDAGAQSQQSLIEVVGGWLFTEYEARLFDNSALASVTTYPDWMIAGARAAITDFLEARTWRSWVPRYCRIELAGTGTRDLWLDRGIVRTADGATLARRGRLLDISEMVSVTVDGSSVSTGNVVIADGRLYRTDAVWPTGTATNPFNVVVEYRYGLNPYTDGSDYYGLLLLRDRLVASNISDRSQSFSDELGTYRFVTAGLGRAVSSIPEVNEWIRAKNNRVPVI